jgi:hypothetical protein
VPLYSGAMQAISLGHSIGGVGTCHSVGMRSENDRSPFSNASALDLPHPRGDQHNLCGRVGDTDQRCTSTAKGGVEHF